MKTIQIKNFIAVITLLWMTSACADLDEVPRDFFVPSNFFSTEADAVAAVTGVYANLVADEVWHQGVWWYGTDIGFTVDPALGFGSYNAGLNADDGIVSLLWTDNYSAINRANSALSGIPGIGMDEGLKTQLLAETRFLRAFYYYNMVELYGDIPLLEESPSSIEEIILVSEKTPRLDIYETVIIPDLQIAVNDLTTERRFDAAVDKYAAAMLLARVYMTLGRHADAIVELDKVIGQGNLGLAANYADLFKLANEFTALPGLDGGMVREDIFDANFSQDGPGNAWVHWQGSESFTPPLATPGGGWGILTPTTDWVAMFDQANDTRFDLFYTDSFTNSVGTGTSNGENRSIINIGKYLDDGGVAAGNNGGMNVRIFRYAGALLLRAEAENEVNGPAGAYQYINDVRRRAGLGPLSGLTKEQLLDSIKIERARELGFEDMRRFDLVRWGDLVSAFRGLEDERLASRRNNIQDFHVRLPIPNNVVEAEGSRILQNTGYSSN